MSFEPANSEDDIEKAIAQVNSLCGSYMSEFYFVYIVEKEIMAMACERNVRVMEWWDAYKHTHDSNMTAWCGIKAILDSRAADRAIQSVLTSS